MEQKKNKILIFIVSYNHEHFIGKVLSRIPTEVWESEDISILIIDDGSSDKTFEKAKLYQEEHGLDGDKLLIYHNPVNQGYGGNQKLGYFYAVENNFDAVVLLHGDGQYAPEIIREIYRPIIEENADAVFGSRMMEKGKALKGGMPLYKYVGNKILTFSQNYFLNASLTEFHSGYRAYRVEALRGIPFALNSNDFHFDTEIIIQLLAADRKIYEVPIPTYYGDEICNVNGMKYAYNVMRQTLLYRLSKFGLMYERKYDIDPEAIPYQLHEGAYEIHTQVLSQIGRAETVLEIGCSQGHFSKKLKEKECAVEGVDILPQASDFKSWDVYHQLDLNDMEKTKSFFQSCKMEKFDKVLLMDVIEHLHEPEQFMEILHEHMTTGQELIISTGNIAFFVTRFALLFGQFNYGKRGILDRTHHRLFSSYTIRHLVESYNFTIEEVAVSIPPVFGGSRNPFVRFSRSTLYWFAKVWKNMFAFQTILVCKKKPGVKEVFGGLQG